MSENCAKETVKEKQLIENHSNNNHLRHCGNDDDVVDKKNACAPPPPPSPLLPPPPPSTQRKVNGSEIPTKKRKTRRGKSKRRHPYNRKNGNNNNNSNIKNNHNNMNGSSRKLSKLLNKPEAPYNSNQFLLEDHGDIEDLDENLKYAEQRSTTSGGRTRDSSISIDTDGEFYSSPDDEEQFLIKDFVDQYESVQAERLQSMTKDDLIREYLALETKVEYLTKRLRKKEKSQQQQLQSQQCDDNDNNNCRLELEKEIDRLINENDALKRELAVLRRDIATDNVKNCTSSDSEDSETDSDDSCSSTTSTTSSSSSNSSCCSKPTSPVIDYSQTNGHSASVETV